MGRIIPVKMNMEPILENRELQYAVKHQGDGCAFQGIWQADQYRDGVLISGGYKEPPNTFCTAGIARLLNIMMHDVAKAGSEIWYVGIFKNSISPAAGDTVAKLGAGGIWGECQNSDYDSPADNKPSYTTTSTTTAVITNAVAGPAEFTMAGSLTVYGAFLSTEKAKTATTGYLLCGKTFTASRAVIADDVLSITYEITVSNP
jgi:hypothetical protein